MVLERLEPHDGLHTLMISGYQGTTFPEWMGKLRKVVELCLFGCKNLQKLPPLCQLQELQLFSLHGLKKLKFLFSGDTPYTFPKLKVLKLEDLLDFERWLEIDGRQRELIMFPQLEAPQVPPSCQLPELRFLSLIGLKKLKFLCSGYTSFTFPKLRELELEHLPDFERWLEIDGRQREQIMFPQLEKLSIQNCKKLTALLEAPQVPPLCQLPELRFLSLIGLKKLKFLCSGYTSFTFPKLRELELEDLPDFERWLEIDGQQREQIMFPQLEKLSIHTGEKLTALQEAPLFPPSCQLPELRFLSLIGLKKLKFLCSGDTSFTFPKLKELELGYLPDFERWLEIDGQQREQIMFPQLEKLSIEHCKKLTALPEAPLLLGDHTSSNSAFPELKEIWLYDLDSLKSWGMTEGIDGEHSTFPNLENATIWGCPELTSFPQAPKLTVLSIVRCGNFFRLSPHWLQRCFVQLQDLSIDRCDGLVHWPEKEFQSLVSLRNLSIDECSELIGYTQSPDQSTSERSQLLPCLESLEISNCESLVEIFNMAASLKRVKIINCPKLELKFWNPVEQQEESAVIQPGTDIMHSTAVQRLSPSATELFLPCLESLQLDGCDSISELLNLPSTLTYIIIYGCLNIESLSGQLDALQKLTIYGCKTLRSLESCSGELPSLKYLNLNGCDCLAAIPNGPESYTALQSLTIKYCPRIKSLPTCLQQRLNDLEEKDIDTCIEGPRLSKPKTRLSKPKTWKYAISRNSRLKP